MKRAFFYGPIIVALGAHWGLSPAQLAALAFPIACWSWHAGMERGIAATIAWVQQCRTKSGGQ